MDVNENSPIVIHSDDDDDDDDVVLVKAEKAPADDDKKDESDVIFISEEPSSSIQKCTLKSQKNKIRLMRRSPNSSTSDDDSSCAIPQIKFFQSKFSSVSLVDDILRPLDLSQGTVQIREEIVQTTEEMPTLITHKLSHLKPVQAACSSTMFQEQQEGPTDKAGDDVEMNSVKILNDFEINSVKEIENTTLTNISPRVDRFAPLKLPDGVEQLSSQTLNTPICKIDPGKECFNMCSQNSTDVNQRTSNLFDASSISSHTCTDKSLLVKDKQVMGTYETNNSLAQVVDISSDDRIAGFTSDLLTPLIARPGELSKSITTEVDPVLVTSELNQTLSTSRNVTSDCSILMPVTSYVNKVNPQPGTSKQFPNFDKSCSSHSETAKLHVPKTKTTHASSGSSLTLDFNNLSTEDLTSLLDLFSDVNDHTPLDNPKVAENNTTIEQKAHPTCIVQTSVNESKTSSTPTHSSSENLLTELSTLQPDNSSSVSSNKLSSARIVQAGCNKTLEKSSIPSSSPKQENVVERLKTKLARIEHNYYTRIRNRKKIPSPYARCLSSSQLTVNSLSSLQTCTKSLKRKYQASRSIGVLSNEKDQHSCKNELTSAPKNSDAKADQTDPAQWQVVSLEAGDVKNKSSYSGKSSEFRQAKRKKIMEHCDQEKPVLKMRLKFSPVKIEQTNNPELSAQIQPSSIGLKKSIIRRHASLTSDGCITGLQRHATIHRSVSEHELNKAKPAGNDNQVLCITCNQTVNSTKVSKCSMGHVVCASCLEAPVKSILTGDIKQKNIRCPANACIEILSFDELKQALPPFVVDILEEKLDKEYISYITKWMFTDEQLKSRSEFATSDTRMPPCPALSMRKYEEIYTQESRDPTEDLPTFWTPMERGAPVMVFEVVPDTEEYRALAFQFHETLNFGDFDIVRIIRVQNPILWKYFALKRSEMVQENDGMDVTEKQLYHGTHRSTLEAIARKGFDWRLSGKHGTVYGCGSYFAKTSRYSHGYTDRAGNGVSVKSGSGPGRIIQPNLGLTSLGMGFTSSTNYLTRIHSRVQSLFNMSQPTLMPIIPPMIAAPNQPPQPPPAHYHLPAPPPAHGQMSSLQLPAHNQTSNPIANKATTINGSAADLGGAAIGCNSHFIKILSVASTSSSVPDVPGPLVSAVPGPLVTAVSGPTVTAVPVPSGTAVPGPSVTAVPGPSSARTMFIQPKYSGFHSSLNSSKPLFMDQLCNPFDFHSASQPSFTSLDSHLSLLPLCSNPTVSFQTQTPISGGRNTYTNPISSDIKLGHLAPSSIATFPVGNKLDSSNNHNQVKHVATSSNETKVQTEASSKHSSSSTSTKLRDHERGTADLSTSFFRDASSETHFMFVARVLVGRHTGGKAGLKRPPPLDEYNPFGKSYDSCVDDIFHPQVFVIFDSNQAYPEYVIEYNWHKN